MYGGYQLELGVMEDFYRMKILDNSDLFQWENLSKQGSAEQYPGPRAWHTMLLANNQIFMYGGKVNSFQSTNQIHCYDISSKTWQ